MTEQLRIRMSVSPNAENIFKITTNKKKEQYINFTTTNLIRKDVANINLEWIEPNIQLFMKLFHKDKCFDGMVFMSISFEEETDESVAKYNISIYQIIPGKKYGFLNLNIQLTDNWKDVKRIIMSSTNDCPICLEETNCKVVCHTCQQNVCKSCLIGIALSMGHINCPFCSVSMDKHNTEENRILIKSVLTNKMNPVSLKKMIVEKYLEQVFTML